MKRVYTYIIRVYIHIIMVLANIRIYFFFPEKDSPTDLFIWQGIRARLPKFPHGDGRVHVPFLPMIIWGLSGSSSGGDGDGQANMVARYRINRIDVIR
jgi:hypothetical protein